MKKNYSISFNDKRQRFGIKYRGIGGAWAQKWAPANFKSHSELEAEQWFIATYSTYLQSGSWEGANDIRPIKTLKVLGPQWLAIRFAATKTGYRYYQNLSSQMNLWLLDSKREHLSIENLDLEKEFSVELIEKWLKSIDLPIPSKLLVAGVLRNFFEDMIGRNILPEAMKNPMRRAGIHEELMDQTTKIRKERTKNIHSLSAEVCNRLIYETKHPIRKVKYLVAIGTGMRDKEIAALTWENVHLDAEVPFVHAYFQVLRPGILPALIYKDIIAKQGKGGIRGIPNAIIKAPKYDSERDIPLHPAVVEGLKEWKRNGWRKAVGRFPRAEDPVFPRSKNHPSPGTYSVPNMAAMLQKDMRALGLDTSRTVYHTLRHCFSSLLKAEGVGTDDRGELLGHAARTTDDGNYARKVLKLQHEWVSKLPIGLIQPAGQSPRSLVRAAPSVAKKA